MTEPVCPYCRMPFEETGPAKIFCTACGTPHHEDCYRENGGCTVFGCARAPADDPKLQVSQSDLRSVSIPAQPYALPAQPYVSAPVSTQPSSPSPYGSSPLGLSHAASPSPAPAAPAAQPAAPSLPPPPTPPGAANSQFPPPPPPPSYGYQYPQAQFPGYQYGVPVLAYPHPPKSRTTYIVLGIFLGALGIHNFFAGYTGRAVGQLCLTVLTLGYLGIVSWIWAIVEICVLDRDSAGVPFQ
jgi:TM2 domain/Prokaryotic RING finger family 1